jgi:hypothetical protein
MSSESGLLIIAGKGMWRGHKLGRKARPTMGCADCAVFQVTSRRLFPVKEQKYLVASAKAQKRRIACCWSVQTCDACTPGAC